MLRQQRLASKVSRLSGSAAGPLLMMSTDAVPDRSPRLDTPATLNIVPSTATIRPGSDRTWNAFQGITFASSHESTPSPRASHLVHGLPSQGTSLQKDPSTEPQTQSGVESRDDNREGSGNVVSTRRPEHLLENQLDCATRIPSSKDDGQFSKSARAEGCPSSDYGMFRTPLGFHIPAEKLHNAMLAEPLSSATYWHYTLYQGPGGDKVKVHYCKSKEATEKVAQLFLEEKIVGFDIEWMKNAKKNEGITKNVSLIQIASESRVLLAHIARYPNAPASEKDQQVEDFVAPSLKKIMESPSISKVGVAIKGDCTRLKSFLRIDSRGLFELSHLYKLVKFSSGNVKKINKMLVSLAQQVQEHLQLPLEKGDVRTGDWSQDLDYQQTQYAASDSYAAVQLYYVLEAKRRALEPTPPRPAHAELDLPIRLADGQTVESFEEASESIEEASTDAPSNTIISLEDEFQKVAIEEPASLYPRLPGSSASTSSSFSSSSTPSPVSQPPPPLKSPPATSPKRDVAPEIVQANASVTEYIEARPDAIKMKPNKAHLRAYHLWEHNSMEPNAIAALLCVDLSTVAVYILQAIKIEHFHFEEKRTQKLVPLAPRAFRDEYETMISKRVKKWNDAAKEKG